MTGVDRLAALAGRLRGLAAQPPDAGTLTEPVARAAARAIPPGGGRFVTVRRTPTGTTVTITGPDASRYAAGVRRAFTAAAPQVQAQAAAETARRLRG